MSHRFPLLSATFVALLVMAGPAGAAPKPRLAQVRITGVAPTSVSVVWHQPRSGRARVELFVNGRRIAVVRSRRFTFSTLKCETQYRLTLRARNPSGRRSGRTRFFVTTSGCAGPDPGDADKGEAPPPLPGPVVPSPAAAPTAVDGQPPSAPAGLTVGKVTTTSIPLSWKPATDNVGVARYAVYLNGTQTLPPGAQATSYTFSGLTCGTAYDVAVQAFDPTGNASPMATQRATTGACPPAAPPAASGACPSNPLQGVQRPGQLTVLDGANPCRTVTGRIAAKHVEHDSDCHLNIRLDAPYTGLLNSVNRAAAGGNLIAEIIPSHALGVPSVGSQVSVFGTWVNDHATGWNELHAIWSITTTGSTGAC